jgi:hypothetical protein
VTRDFLHRRQLDHVHRCLLQPNFRWQWWKASRNQLLTREARNSLL